MVNNKRKKKQKDADFKKVKLKVGKKLPKGDNETQISFKSQGIAVPSQDLMKDGHLTNNKRQNLKDLLVHLNHYSATVRQDSLLGLKALFQQHPSELHDNLSLVLNSVAGKMVDTDADVRHALLLLLKLVLPKISSDQVAPFLPLLEAHLSCAMTHIYGEIQMQSMKFLSLIVEYFPHQMKTHSNQILNNLLGLLSQCNLGNQHPANAKVKVSTVVLDGKLASPKSKLNILGQIYGFLKIVQSAETTMTSNTDFPRYLDCSTTHVDQNKNTHIPITANRMKALHFQRFYFEVKGDFDQVQGLSGIKEFIQRIVPLLLEFWVECSTSQLTSPLPDRAPSSLNLSEMMTIIGILKIIVHVLCNEESLGEMQYWFTTSFLKDFKMHFLRFFPYQVMFSIKSKGKNKCSDSSDTDSLLMLNVSICEIMSVFTAHLTGHESWIQNIEEFIVETLEINAKKIKVQHLKSILAYMNIVIKTNNSGRESFTKSLESLYRIYYSSHTMSAVKVEILKFFAVLLFKLDQMVLSGFKVPIQLEMIMLKWTNSLPKLLAQLQKSNPKTSNIVVKLLSKLLIQKPDSIDYKEINKELISFLGSRGLCSLPVDSQKLLVDLIFNLPIIEGELLKTLALCSHHEDADIDFVQYLLYTLHYRSSDQSKPSALPQHALLSFLFSVAIGCSSEALNKLQTKESERFVYSYHLYEEKLEENSIRVIERHLKILEVVCVIFNQMQDPKSLLKKMEPALESLLKNTQTLPVAVAHSILMLYGCYWKLSSSASDHCSSVIVRIARLSLLCLVLYIQDDQSSYFEFHESLYRDVTAFLHACPPVLKHLLNIMSTCQNKLAGKVQIISAKLIHSLEEMSNSFASYDILRGDMGSPPRGIDI